MSDYEKEEWHRLHARLEHLCAHCPKSVWSASVQVTRKWKEALKRSQKTLNKKTATNSELMSAINEMENFE